MAELKTVKILRAKDMTQEQRKELKVGSRTGLVAIERYNPEYKEEVKVLKGGICNYITNGN